MLLPETLLTKYKHIKVIPDNRPIINPSKKNNNSIIFIPPFNYSGDWGFPHNTRKVPCGRNFPMLAK